MIARGYQDEAKASVLAEWEKVRSTLVVMATGLGKTYLATMLAEARRSHGRGLFLCHSSELVWQAYDAFKGAMGEEPDVEMGRYRAVTNPLSGRLSPIVIGTVQTQYSGNNGQGRMTRLRDIGTLLLDEAHHYVSEAWLRVIRHHQRENPDMKIVGFTATPDRLDKKAMGRVFDSVAYRYGISDGIEHGWLVPVDQYTAHMSDLNLAEVPATAAGDLNPDVLAEVLEQKKNLFAMADQIVDRVGDRKTLVFASSVRHAELLAAIFNDRKKSAGAEWVCGETDPLVRRDMFRRFYRRDFQFLCNVDVATEGFNDEGVEVVAVGRPTCSRSKYTQMAGRGTRVLPGVVDYYDHADDRKVAIGESDKPCVELIDFVGNAGRHKLVTAVDILGGNYDEEVVARVKKKSEGRAVNVTDELEAEWAKLKQERADDASLEASRLAQLRVTSNTLFEAVDPFNSAGDRAGANMKRHEPQKRGSPATESQLRMLANSAPKGTKLSALTIGQAGALISEIRRRRDKGLCSIDQSRALRKNGLPPDVPRSTAKVWMDRLAANRWQVPPEVWAEARLYRETAKETA